MFSHIKSYGHNTFHSLKVRNYRLYFMGQAVSMSGTWMQRIAQSWLVLSMTGSGTAVGLVVAFQYLPVLIFGPFGGVIADRFPKRKVLYFTQGISGLLALILGILVVTKTAELWMVYLLASLLGLSDAIDSPTRQTFIHEMVGSERIKNAVTLNSILANMGKVIGPAIAGIVIATSGIGVCFFLNAISFAAVIICLSYMRDAELHRTEPIKETKGQLVNGLRYIQRTPVIRNILIMMAIVGTLTYEFQVSLPLIAKFTFHGDAKSYALLMSAMGVGSILGGLVTASRKSSGPVALSWATIILGLTIVGGSLAPNMTVAAVFMLFSGVCAITFSAIGNSTIQLISEPSMRGRVMALWTVAFLGTTPIGGPIVGWIGEHIDPRASLLVGGLAAILAGLFGIITLRKASFAAHELAPIQAESLS